MPPSAGRTVLVKPGTVAIGRPRGVLQMALSGPAASTATGVEMQVL